MTANKRLSGAVAILTMAAVGALGLPSQALAGKSHHLKLYKVERHVDVEGDELYDVSCKTGDIATDGMWRVDDVSQDNEFDILGQWKETVAVQANGISERTYRFRFLPIAGGDVQVKLWVTCLENPVQGQGHSNQFVTTQITGTGAAVTAPNGSVSYTLLPGAGTNVTGSGATNDCRKGQYVPIQPGFDMTNVDNAPPTYEGYGYLQKNWDASNATDVGWEWRFNVVGADNLSPSDNFRVNLSYRCLRLKSNASVPGGTHSHRIVQQYKTKLNNVVEARTFKTHQVHCGEHYKGMVGMWDIDHNDLYYLGMDPRIKSRAFKFVNTGLVDHQVDLKLSCFKDRTT